MTDTQYINSTQQSDPDHDLAMGELFPFEASDAWWKDGGLPPPAAADWSVAAARGVLANLQDRRSIKQGFVEIDEDVRTELVASLAAIIRRARERDSNVRIMEA